MTAQKPRKQADVQESVAFPFRCCCVEPRGGDTDGRNTSRGPSQNELAACSVQPLIPAGKLNIEEQARHDIVNGNGKHNSERGGTTFPQESIEPPVGESILKHQSEKTTVPSQSNHDSRHSNGNGAINGNSLRATEFKVQLHKTGNSDLLGLNIDLLDGVTAHVCEVGPGLVARHNETCAPNKQIQPNDFIMSVNGVTGESMPQVMRGDGELHLSIRRGPIYDITIEKQNGTLGLEFKYVPDGYSLLVGEVFDGPVKNVNENVNSEHTVRPGDRIIAVNGRRGRPAVLLNEIKRNTSMELSVVSPLNIKAERFLHA